MMPRVEIKASKGLDVGRLTDLNRDIRNQLGELKGQAVKGLGDSGFKLVTFHGRRLREQSRRPSRWITSGCVP